MSQELPPCTVETCDRPTQEYMCAECTAELQDAWDAIPELLPVLEAISRNEDVAFGQPTAGGRGGAIGSRPPMNLSAYQLHLNLGQALVFTPSEYAQHEDGARSKWMIEDQVKRGNIMVHGEKEDKPTEDYVKYRVLNAEPKSTKELVQMFKKMGINLKTTNLSTWAADGRIERANPETDEHGTKKHPTYDPYQVYNVYRQSKLGRKKLHQKA